MLADAKTIISRSIAAVLPDEAVRRALDGRSFARPVTLVAIGKAAWRMANRKAIPPSIMSRRISPFLSRRRRTPALIASPITPRFRFGKHTSVETAVLFGSSLFIKHPFSARRRCLGVRFFPF